MSGLEMRYFVVKPRGGFRDPYAKASREALRTYAREIEEENPQLAHDLKNWVISEQHRANTADLEERLSDSADRRQGK